MWVLFDVVVVVLQDFEQKLVLAMMDSLDDEPVIAREIEE